MLHDMHLDHAERSAGLVGHRVDGEVKGSGTGQETANLEVRVVVEGDGEGLLFVSPKTSGAGAEPRDSYGFSMTTRRVACCAVMLWASSSGR